MIRFSMEKYLIKFHFSLPAKKQNVSDWFGRNFTNVKPFKPFIFISSDTIFNGNNFSE